MQEGNFLVLATGYAATLAGPLGLDMSPDGVKIDLNGRTSKDRIYAGGAAARGKKSQVATSVGDGAAIAVDIMSRLAGKPTHDYDVLPK
jgi:thioredoxin reductase